MHVAILDNGNVRFTELAQKETPFEDYIEIREQESLAPVCSPHIRSKNNQCTVVVVLYPVQFVNDDLADLKLSPPRTIFDCTTVMAMLDKALCLPPALFRGHYENPLGSSRC